MQDAAPAQNCSAFCCTAWRNPIPRWTENRQFPGLGCGGTQFANSSHRSCKSMARLAAAHARRSVLCATTRNAPASFYSSTQKDVHDLRKSFRINAKSCAQLPLGGRGIGSLGGRDIGSLGGRGSRRAVRSLSWGRWLRLSRSFTLPKGGWDAASAASR